MMSLNKARQEVVEANGVGIGSSGRSGEQGGFLSTMASKIDATMSETNGSGEVSATMVSSDMDGKRYVNAYPGQEGGFLAPSHLRSGWQR